MLASGLAAASRAPKFPFPTLGKRNLLSGRLLSLAQAVARPGFDIHRYADVAEATIPVLPPGGPSLDAMLAGGIRRDALHEVTSTLARDNGAATGFAVAILASLAAIDPRQILWIVQGASAD